MKVYFISGLGADKRVFNNIVLQKGFESEFLNWINPEKDETLESYSLRLAQKINFSESFALVGLSMGGMIAVEIAKHYKVDKLILLSSVPKSSELPRLYRMSMYFKFHKMLPVAVFKSASLLKWFFNVDTPENKILMKQIVKDADTNFIKWALNAIVLWKNDVVPGSLYHIHGDHDFLLPLRNTTATHIIKGGSHMMVLNKAKEVSLLINNILSER